jgi:glycosyltransferase involved in cell wall biosynthesis
MEASASGLPIVATNIRGCRQVVMDGKTGYLVPTRSPGQLAGAMERLATDANVRLTFGAAGRKKALEQFDQRSVIRRTLAAYEMLDG